MHAINSHWVLVAIAAACIGLAVWLFYRKTRTGRRQDRLGPNHGRAVDDRASQAKSDREPARPSRIERIERIDIVPLTAAEAARSIRSWYGLQGRFVNNPQNVVAQADQLVRELMQMRGYPMANFERLAADIAAEHPAVVNNYRAAQAIAVRAERGHAAIDELRQAVVYYRAVFDELLEANQAPTAGAPPQTEMAVHS